MGGGPADERADVAEQLGECPRQHHDIVHLILNLGVACALFVRWLDDDERHAPRLAVPELVSR